MGEQKSIITDTLVNSLLAGTMGSSGGEMPVPTLGVSLPSLSKPSPVMSGSPLVLLVETYPNATGKWGGFEQLTDRLEGEL